MIPFPIINNYGNIVYPGPGSKHLLYGTPTLGYFGRVSTTELFTAAQVLAGTGLGAQTIASDSNLIWMKFFYNNKIIYYPSQYLVQNLTWNQLYAGGVVYGTNNTGLYPGSPAVNQYRTLSKVDISTGQNWTLKIRLPSGSLTDPTSGALNTSAELFATFNKVFNNTIQYGSSSTMEWDNIGSPIAKLANFFPLIETQTGASTYTFYGALHSPQISGAVLKSSNSADRGWFPVLELV